MPHGSSVKSETPRASRPAVRGALSHLRHAAHDEPTVGRGLAVLRPLCRLRAPAVMSGVAALLVVLAAGCGPSRWRDPPQLGAVARTHVETRRCTQLEIGIVARSENNRLLVEILLRNADSKPAFVDLTRLEFVALVGGEWKRLTLSDPHHEVAPRHIDAGAIGVERFRLVPEFAPHEIARLCADVTAVIASPTPLAPICLSRTTPAGGSQ